MTSSTFVNDTNPVMDAEQRNFVSLDNREFQFVIQVMHEEFTNDTDCLLKYCGTCHNNLTSAGAKIHEKCKKIYSSTSIAGSLYNIIFLFYFS